MKKVCRITLEVGVERSGALLAEQGTRLVARLPRQVSVKEFLELRDRVGEILEALEAGQLLSCSGPGDPPKGG